MFGSFTANTAGTDFGERMLNKVASQSIRHLFTESESVEVAIRCNPSSKLLQGSIDSFRMSGRNLVIRRDFQVQEMSFETDAVVIDFGSVLSGAIRLRQPTQAVAQVVLSEAGLNHAFTAELVQKRLQNLDTPDLTKLSGGEPVSFSDVHLELLPENQLKIFAKAHLPNGVVPISLSSTLAVERRKRIVFQDAQFEPDLVPENLRGISEILTLAFIDILNNMVDLDRFDLDGVLMRINRLETQGQQLIFSGYAQIEHFPWGN
ncbi:LmeA family phospholipid-binding protein [Leptodesmis sp.]|uniref:LmeA family phospholipid-binding protein n=1 Tax=Leptodesmis sp. TaxID=3100501 RepID=UPI0040534BD0